jgi:hypothetical protein
MVDSGRAPDIQGTTEPVRTAARIVRQSASLRAVYVLVRIGIAIALRSLWGHRTPTIDKEIR